MNETLIVAAGGNGTAIEILDRPLSRHDYESRGRVLGEKMEADGAEQAGFLIRSQHHFEMAGGEFCGNATRAAALLFSEFDKTPHVSFTVSGFEGLVAGEVESTGANTYHVRCTFPKMPTSLSRITLADGQDVAVVDLGGIVHVVVQAPFPSDDADYRLAHRAIMEELELAERDAVGVVWIDVRPEGVVMHPVVWVKAVDTFFYEQSCGSGTIAVGRVTGQSTIVQPTGKSISVVITEDAVVLQSDMEITHGKVFTTDQGRVPSE